MVHTVLSTNHNNNTIEFRDILGVKDNKKISKRKIRTEKEREKESHNLDLDIQYMFVLLNFSFGSCQFMRTLLSVMPISS